MNLFTDVFKTVFSDEGNRQREFKESQKQLENQMPTPEVRESYSGEIVDAETIIAKGRTTKTAQVLKHLKEKGSIDSWTAIQQYGATRLSAIIFVLRRRGFDIVSIPNSVLDRNNNVCNYTNYQLLKK
jgi:acetolactate synthase small subunit